MPDPIHLPTLPPRARSSGRRRRSHTIPCRAGFKLAWGAAVTAATIAGWVVNHCDPGGRVQPLWDAVGALIAPAPHAAPAGSDGKPLGQSGETH